MNREERKKELLELLEKSGTALTGNVLAEKFHVTRQIIVKDVELLKAEGNDVISTAKGYFIPKKKEKSVQRVITVCHGTENIEHELQIVVDLGGKILTTFVEHSFYGTLGQSLNVKSRKDIQAFLEKIQKTGCQPLLLLTKGVHKHTIEAEDEKTLDEICEALNRAGYLIL